MTPSLHRRLVGWLLGATLLAWIAAAAVGVARTRAEVQALFDAQLSQSAGVLMSLLRHEMIEQAHGSPAPAGAADAHFAELASHLSAHRYESPVAFQIWARDGALRYHSANAPAEAFGAGGEGFSDVTVRGTRWRVFSRRDDASRTVIRVAERRSVRTGLVNQVARQLVWPLIVFLPVLGLIVWSAVSRGIRPLSALARAIAARDPLHLGRIDTPEVPREVVPLVEALDRLLERLERALEGERRFTADAAHELRTPLAALKTHAQVAVRATDGESRRRALLEVVAGVDRAAHVVAQMLALARLDPEAAGTGLTDVALDGVVREQMAELAGEALRRGIELELAPPDAGARLRGNEQALRVMVRNVLDNAIRYSPDGGRVRVRAGTDADGALCLRVADDGPGIPPEARRDVFRRFHRAGTSGQPGSGLGLSIVERAAELHGAAVHLADGADGGLVVTVRFPRPGAAAAMPAAPAAPGRPER